MGEVLQAGVFDPSPESLRTNPFLQPAPPPLQPPAAPPPPPAAGRGAAVRKRLVLDDSNPLVAAAPVLPDPPVDAALSQERACMEPAAAAGAAAPDAMPARSRELPACAAAASAGSFAPRAAREHGGAEPAGLDHAGQEHAGAEAEGSVVEAVATPEGYRNPFAALPPAAAAGSDGSAAHTPEPAADAFAWTQVAATPDSRNPFAVPPPPIRMPPRPAGPTAPDQLSGGPHRQGLGSGSPAHSMRMGSGGSGGTCGMPGWSSAAWRAPAGAPGDAGYGVRVMGGAMQPSASAPLGGAAALLLGREVRAASRVRFESASAHVCVKQGGFWQISFHAVSACLGMLCTSC